MAWYSGWYNGLDHKHYMDYKKGRELEHLVIEYCKAHQNEKHHSRHRREPARHARRRADAREVRGASMKNLLLSTALCVAAPLGFGDALANAQQTVTFLCAAPAGHVCQFAVQTGGSQMAFALPSGERKEVPGITPHADKYCVCDPGPVTPDCKAPRLDHWCLGSWLDVDTGLNSENEIANDRFAADLRSGTVGVSRASPGTN